MSAAEDRQVRPFAAWLQEQRGGLTHRELSDGLNELVEAVQETGRGGQITFTIKVKPAGKATGMLVVNDEVKVKLPEHDRAEAFFFVDDDCNLVRHNPNQPELPLREVPRDDEGEIREVAADA